MDPSLPDDFAEKQRRFYNRLAVILVTGVALSLIFGFGMKEIPWGLGFFGVAELTRALLGSLLVVTVVLSLFLLRIGNIFDIDRKVDTMFQTERERLDASRKAEVDSARQFRDDVRSELAGLRESWRRDLAAQDGRMSDAIRAANQAQKAVQDALARLDGLSREPAYRTTIENLVEKMDGLVKDVAALRGADKVNSPLLKELQEKVVALEKGQVKIQHRMDETIEGMERRDMEQAAIRTTVETELGNLKKRETLLLVKQKELEDVNLNLREEGKRGRIQF